MVKEIDGLNIVVNPGTSFCLNYDLWHLNIEYSCSIKSTKVNAQAVSAVFTFFHQAADDNLRDVSGEEENLTDSVELKLDLSLDQEDGVKVS